MLPTPEVFFSNPVIGQIPIDHQLFLKDENKEKDAGNGPFYKLLKLESEDIEAIWPKRKRKMLQYEKLIGRL